MNDEFQFKCEICGKVFDANPDTMIECQVDVNLVDESTGEIIEVSPEEREEIMKEACAEDSELKKFSQGAICMCIECQDKFVAEADEVTPLEDGDVEGI